MKYFSVLRKGFIYASVCSMAMALSGCSNNNNSNNNSNNSNNSSDSENTIIDSSNNDTSNEDIEVDEKEVLNLANTNILSSGLVGTPWKNQCLFTGLMFRTLFETELGEGIHEEDLVESYSISDDGLVYEFVLKEDVVWSDGEILDVDDVIFSIKGLLLSEQFNGIYQVTFGNIIGATEFMDNKDINGNLSGIEKDGNKLILTLQNPTANMIAVLGQFAILPEHCFTESNIFEIDRDDYWKDPVVSGMYKVKEIVYGDHIRLCHNPEYKGVLPKIEELVLHTNYSDMALDVYTTNDVSEILEYRANINMKEYSVDSLFYRYLLFNIDKGGEIDPVLNDIRFRQAVAYAIDRETLLSELYYNIGSVVDSAIVSKESEAYLESGITYDPEKAKELLLDMDYDFTRPVRIFYYYTDETSKKFINETKSYLEAIGLTIEIIEYNGMSLFVFDDYDICLKGLSAFDISEWYTEYQSTNAFHINLIGGESKFDGLIESLVATNKEDEKVEILKDLQELEFDSLYKVPLFTLNHTTYVNKNKISLPEDVYFGNTWYKYDVDFENWEFK